MCKKNVVKIIDYVFQHQHQLIEAYDDSNSMRYLSDDLKITVVGRFNSPDIIIRDVENYEVIFFPATVSPGFIARYVENHLRPDVIHMHGNSSWSSYPLYAKWFYSMEKKPKMIFSPAGSSCGTPEFLSYFDHIVVNHPLQIERMKTPDKSKVIVRKRSADPAIFYPKYADKIEYDLVYVAGFVPVKQIEVMMDLVVQKTDKTLVVLGDFSRTREHYAYVKDRIKEKMYDGQVTLHDFIPQTQMSEFLGKCGVFVWPNIRPENPSTTTNRAVTEAMAMGMPLLLGEQAFKDTYYIRNGKNGFLYGDAEKFANNLDMMFQFLDHFRIFAQKINKEEFSFKENFINFYKILYGKEDSFCN